MEFITTESTPIHVLRPGDLFVGEHPAGGSIHLYRLYDIVQLMTGDRHVLVVDVMTYDSWSGRQAILSDTLQRVERVTGIRPAPSAVDQLVRAEADIRAARERTGANLRAVPTPRESLESLCSCSTTRAPFRHGAALVVREHQPWCAAYVKPAGPTFCPECSVRLAAGEHKPGCRWLPDVAASWDEPLPAGVASVRVFEAPAGPEPAPAPVVSTFDPGPDETMVLEQDPAARRAPADEQPAPGYAVGGHSDVRRQLAQEEHGWEPER